MLSQRKIVHYGSAYIKYCGRDVLKFTSDECWTGIKNDVTCKKCKELIEKELLKMIKPSNVVRCINRDEKIARLCGSLSELSDLVIGDTYIVKNVEEHSWYTMLTLFGVEGKFNSCHFELFEKFE